MDRDPAVTQAGTYARPVAPVANVNAPPAYTTGSSVLPRDAVRWGPIWAGLLVAIGSYLLLSLLALVIGIQTVNSGVVEAQTATQTGALVAAVLAVVAFLIGGFVAGRTSAISGRASGFLNGFMVWALGILLIAILSAVGGGELFCGLNELFRQLRALTVTAGQQVDREQIAASLRDSALITFLSMAIPALAASVGGWLGARGGDEDLAY